MLSGFYFIFFAAAYEVDKIFPGIGKNDTSQELSKISFTYYGISPSHLEDVLHFDGLEDVTYEEIVKQNPSAQIRFDFWKALPMLVHLCMQSDENGCDNFDVVEERNTPITDDYVDFSGRSRTVRKR